MLDARIHPRLGSHKSYFEKRRRARAATDRVIFRHRTAIVERQFVLERLANMAIELVATACAISRTQSLIDERGVEACEREIHCAISSVEAGHRFRADQATERREEEVDQTRRSVAAIIREEKSYFVKDAILDL